MNLTPRQALALYYQELKRRKSKPLSLIDDSFDKQAAFLRDPARLKAGLCTRRAGKSYGAASLMFEVALAHPGSSVLYIALTRDSAKKIMWKDCVKVLDRKFKLGCKFNETELTATLSNGSVIYLTGADAKPDEMEKLLGQKYPLVVIDEAASWRQDLNKLVYGILSPAVADYDGSIVMIGTPGNITKGLYFDVTNGKEGGWSVHKWSTFDNPYMRDKWAKQIEMLRTAKPGIEETPLFKQMYLGEWFIDTEKLCYKFNPARNTARKLPEDTYHYVLGVDLGYDPDPSAFVVCCYSEFDPNLYVVETYKQTKMIISDVAERIRYYLKKYPFATVTIDASAKQSVEEMRQRYSLSLIAAEKQDKAGFIEIMNSDLITGNIKILDGACDELAAEWAQLVWDENSTKRVENPACDNHLADAALYAWRYCYNYAHRARPKIIRPHSEEAIDQFWENEAERIQRGKHGHNDEF